MSRRRYVWHDGDWRDVTGWRPPPRKTPYLIRDSMDALRHPCSGDLIDSKSAFRRVTREHGCEEVGDQAPTTAAPPAPLRDIKAAVAEAYQMVREGYTPPPVRTLAEANAADGLPSAELRTYN